LVTPEPRNILATVGKRRSEPNEGKKKAL